MRASSYQTETCVNRRLNPAISMSDVGRKSTANVVASRAMECTFVATIYVMVRSGVLRLGGRDRYMQRVPGAEGRNMRAENQDEKHIQFSSIHRMKTRIVFKCFC